jgi:hypothetical protein
MVLFLPGSVHHYHFQGTLANRERTVTFLPFELSITVRHVIDGIRACAF